MAQLGKEISQDQQVNFLRKIDFFHDFDNHELRQLLAVTNWLKLPENSLVIKEGAHEQLFYILVKGTVGVFKTNSETGERIPLTTLKTGNCFGEMSLVEATARSATVIATSQTRVFRLPNQELQRLAEEDPQCMNRVLVVIVRTLSSRLRRMNDTLATVAQLSDWLAGTIV